MLSRRRLLRQDPPPYFIGVCIRGSPGISISLVSPGTQMSPGTHVSLGHRVYWCLQVSLRLLISGRDTLEYCFWGSRTQSQNGSPVLHIRSKFSQRESRHPPPTPQNAPWQSIFLVAIIPRCYQNSP